MHHFHKCQNTGCNRILKEEMDRVKMTKKKDRFQHEWLFKREECFCPQTGIWWLVYLEIISHRAFCGPLKPITLGDKILNVVSETRCLGVIIDSQLSWNSHSDHLCKSFGKKVGQLKRFKYLSTRTLETIYFSSIVPTITYCSLVWGTSSPSLMYELEHIHARAAKTIHRLPRDISDQDALETTGWEPLTNQYKKKLLTLMYKVNSNITPDKITNLFRLANSYYNLRNSNHFVLPDST